MSPDPTTKTALVNGLCLKCPRCGKGKLFKSYLKPVDACSHCHQSFKSFRADDGPAWLTILITGHITVPLLVWMVQTEFFPYWAEIVILFSLTTLLVLAFLPVTKGFFIAVLWLTSRKKVPA